MKNPEGISRRGHLLWIGAMVLLLSLPAIIAFYTLAHDSALPSSALFVNGH